MRKKILSGIQPTGQIHLGNYLGALKQWVAFQNEYDCVYTIVDLHAITVPPYSPEQLRTDILELAAILIACGLDVEKTILFVQSDVHEHSELSWILSCVTPLGWLQRMTQFKEKSAQHKEQASAGLFTYPVLQAADILLYDTDLVPVGEDQKQHIEITRDITQRFNNLFGETFKMPDYFIPEVAARVMGLDDPSKKMSKSEKGSNHSILLIDDKDTIMKKIKRAVTDSQRTIVFDEKREGLFNLLSIYEALKYELDNPKRNEFVDGRKATQVEIEKHFAGKGYKELKEELGELIYEKLKPIQERYKEIVSDKAYLKKILAKGAERAREIAHPILQKAKKAAGLGA